MENSPLCIGLYLTSRVVMAGFLNHQQYDMDPFTFPMAQGKAFFVSIGVIYIRIIDLSPAGPVF